jgi:hypothetical protein
MLALAGTMACVGCTTYPQNYTYSPQVTVNGGSGGDITLPNPFSKAPQPTKTYSNRVRITQVDDSYYEPIHHLPERIPTPYIQTSGTYYYEADPDSTSLYANKPSQPQVQRDLDQELGDYIIP